MSFRDYEEFGFHVITLAPDGHRLGEYLALCNNIMVARAAFYAILPERVGNVVLLMQRSRILLDSRVAEDVEGAGAEGAEGKKKPADGAG
jgi:hypothetical protein